MDNSQDLAETGIDDVDPETTELDRRAIAAANQPVGWFPYIYALKKGGIEVTGCMTTKLVRGKNKGQRKFLTKENRVKVFLPTPKGKECRGGS